MYDMEEVYAMSLDNGLLLKKVSHNKYELHYIVADNVSLVGIYEKIEDAIQRIVEEQKYGLEYGTHFEGF